MPKVLEFRANANILIWAAAYEGRVRLRKLKPFEKDEDTDAVN